jgi:hypothetical protein
MRLKSPFVIVFITGIVILAMAVGYLLLFSRFGNVAGFFRPGETAEMSRKAEEAKIVAATLCYQLTQQQIELKVKVIFLFIGDNQDPSDSLLTQVRCGSYDFRKVSQSTMDAGAVKDKNTGEEGLILGVTSIKWEKATEVLVTGRMQLDRENSLTHVFHVVKEENNRWVVKETKLTGET